MCLTWEQVNLILKRSLERLKNDDEYLLRVDASERAIAHHLAKYIEQELPVGHELSVDVEFNRNGHFDIKKIIQFDPIEENGEDGEKARVFPDIIVHKRGENGPNILVLEIKKFNASVKLIEYDKRKLRAYVGDPLMYLYAALVSVGVCAENTDIQEIEWIKPSHAERLQASP